MSGESLRDRLSALSRGELVGLAILVVATVGGAGLWYVRSLPRAVEVRARPGARAAPGPTVSPSPAVLLVHVAGSRGRLLPPVRAALSEHGAQILVYGHSHQPRAALEGDVLLVNPGSAGPRRFRLPRSAGLLEVRGRSAEVRLFDLASARLSLLGPPLATSW